MSPTRVAHVFFPSPHTCTYATHLPRALRQGGKQTHWVPDAQFYFESEDALSEFVPQRRRCVLYRSNCLTEP